MIRSLPAIITAVFIIVLPTAAIAAPLDISLTDFESICKAENGQFSLGRCIEGIYTRSFYIAGLAAFFLILYGGYVYLTAAGNASRVNLAWGYIKSALFGLAILFSAYTILYTINPDLVGQAGEGFLGAGKSEDGPSYKELERICSDLTDIDGAVPAPDGAKLSAKLLTKMAEAYKDDSNWKIDEALPKTSGESDPGLKYGYAAKIKMKSSVDITEGVLNKVMESFFRADLTAEDHYRINGAISPDGFIYVRGSCDVFTSIGSGDITGGENGNTGDGGTSSGDQGTSTGGDIFTDPVFDVQPRSVASGGSVQIAWDVTDKVKDKPDALIFVGIPSSGNDEGVPLNEENSAKGRKTFRPSTSVGSSLRFALRIYENERITVNPFFSRQVDVTITSAGGGGGGSGAGGGGGGDNEDNDGSSRTSTIGTQVDFGLLHLNPAGTYGNIKGYTTGILFHLNDTVCAGVLQGGRLGVSSSGLSTYLQYANVTQGCAMNVTFQGSMADFCSVNGSVSALVTYQGRSQTFSARLDPADLKCQNPDPETPAPFPECGNYLRQPELGEECDAGLVSYPAESLNACGSGYALQCSSLAPYSCKKLCFNSSTGDYKQPSSGGGGGSTCPSILGACTTVTSCGAFSCGGENWYCRSGSWVKEGQVADCTSGNYCATTSCGGNSYYCTNQGWQVPPAGKTCQNGQFN